MQENEKSRTIGFIRSGLNFSFYRNGLNAHSAAGSCKAAGSPEGALCGMHGEAERNQACLYEPFFNTAQSG